MKLELQALVLVTVDLEDLRQEHDETTEELTAGAKEYIESLMRSGFDYSTRRYVTVDGIEVNHEHSTTERN
jgi:hypothetical protein